VADPAILSDAPDRAASAVRDEGRQSVSVSIGTGDATVAAPSTGSG